MNEPRVLITLPNKEEIMRRLATVTVLSGEIFRKDLFSIIAKSAGKNISADGLVGVILKAIADFMTSGGYPPFMDAIVSSEIPNIIDALVDDENLAQEAKDHYEGLIASKSKTKN